MYKMIKDFFTTNLYWKAVSVLMAIVLWFVVMNISNPTEIKTFTLNVSLINKDKLDASNIVLLNMQDLENQKAEIKIKASRTTLDELSKKINRENIKLTIDLEQFSTYKIGDKPLETTVNLKPDLPSIPYPNNAFEIVSFAPVTANVYVDKVITVEKRLYPKINGKVKEGYILSKPILSSQTIKVTGPKSVLDTIQKIYLEIDVTNKTSNLKEAIKPVAYNDKGEIVEGIKFDKSTITVNLPITSNARIDIQKPKLIGKSPDGYMVDSVYYEPQFIEVVGDSNDIKGISYITLPNIDISNLKEDTNYTYNISTVLENNNLVLKSGSTNINVNIKISKAGSKNITLAPEDIEIKNMQSGFSYTITNGVNISLRGKEENIKNIDKSRIRAYIDATNLKEGIQNIKLNLELPDGVVLNGEVYVELDIKKVGNEDTTKEQSSTSTTEEPSTNTETITNEEVIESTS